MKKILFYLLLTILPATVCPAAEPVAEADAAAPLYGIDASAGVGIPNDRHDKRFVGTMLVGEVEVARMITPHHAFTISTLVGYGEENHDGMRWDSRQTRPFTDNYERWTLSLMPGYRFTQHFSRYVSLQLGAKAGPDLQSLHFDFGRNMDAKPQHQYDGYNPYTGKRMTSSRNDHTYSLGLAYAAGAKLSVHPQPNIGLHLGYTLWGSTTQPTAYFSGGAHPIKRKAESLLRHEIRVGLSVSY